MIQWEYIVDKDNIIDRYDNIFIGRRVIKMERTQILVHVRYGS